MTLVPTITSINGRGKPRLYTIDAEDSYVSLGSVSYSATGVTEGDATPQDLLTSATGTPTWIEVDDVTLVMNEGDSVTIAGHSGSTPDLNGTWEVVGVNRGASLFAIPAACTVAGSGGTVTRHDNLRSVLTGARVISSVTRAGQPDLEVYGKITAVDRDNGIITVDEWVGGTPTAGKAFAVNGSVVDLPYCYELTETFEPDQLIHNLWRSRLGTKFYGWKYTCTLDYARHIQASVLLDMRPILNLKEDTALVLIPHMDKPQYQYNVIHAEPISLSRFGYGPGHKKPVFVFRGKESSPSWPLPTGGYGYGYGQNWGFQE